LPASSVQNISTAIPQNGSWHNGTVHLHTGYSDGQPSILDCANMARDTDSSFLILTDHYEEINQSEKILGISGKAVGIQNYIAGCQYASSVIPVIPGAEIESEWLPEPNATQNARAHTLVFPITSESPERSGLLDKPQQEILDRVARKDWISIAAHPNWMSKHTMPENLDPREIWSKVKQWGDFRYDLRPANETSGQINYQNLCGIEFFNVEKREQNQGVLDVYRRLLREGRKVCVTGGNDSHGWEAVTDRTDYRYSCQTSIFGQCTQEGIIDALKNGRSTATACGPRFVSVSPVPCFAYQNVSRASFQLTLTKPKKMTMPEMFNLSWEKLPKMEVYLIDKLIAEVAPKFVGSQVIYQWTDQNNRLGQQLFFLYVPNIFVSSPIYLNITGSGSGRDRILIDQGPHHLGDDRIDSETLWWKEFALTSADLAGHTNATFRFRVKGTPRKDPVVSFNRGKIGSAVTFTNKWEWFEFPVPVSVLRAGSNLIDVETVIANLGNTFDDCEFADCWLIFN